MGIIMVVFSAIEAIFCVLSAENSFVNALILFIRDKLEYPNRV
jgi:hypothetical protein